MREQAGFANPLSMMSSGRSSYTRRVIARLINKRVAMAPIERPSKVGKRLWSAVTATALGRAAVQLARLTALDGADLCPQGVLALRTAREKTVIPRGFPWTTKPRLQPLLTCSCSCSR